MSPHMRRRTVLGGLVAAGVGVGGLGIAAGATAVPGAPGVPGVPGEEDGRRKAADPDFGPHVSVFSPDTPAAEIQAKLDEVFGKQEEAQFGDGRFALLFKPGTYDGVDANIGFYTHIAGLGLSPDDVVVKGAVHAEADWFDGNATQNFWRCAENLCVEPKGGADRWAVSQAAPYRRMHVRGDLQLDDGGWSSGGLMADTKVDGQVRSGSQQQWLSRNTDWGSWDGSNWNMVFVGAKNAPGGDFPSPPYTRVEQTPKVREKPFLYVDDAGSFAVFVPALRSDSAGTSWDGGAPEGGSLPIGDFLIATPDTSASAMNEALDGGRHLLLTPGVYALDGTLKVTRAGTVVLGLGLATLVPAAGKAAMTVADVDGVKLAGFLIDAGEGGSPALMEVGPEGADGDHAADPTSLHDVFFRIGGPHAAQATRSLVVNSNHVIGDHTWLWRGDHGDGIGWKTNPADTGLVVEGDDVTFYGLFAEHYQKYQVVWNGERGRTYFFQNEMPYDPPDQGSWMNGDTRGYAAYKVADGVGDHEAWGMGSYCFFNVDPEVTADRAFEVPDAAGVKLHHMVAVSLGGTGTIAHVVNGTGGPADKANQVAYLTEYGG